MISICKAIKEAREKKKGEEKDKIAAESPRFVSSSSLNEINLHFGIGVASSFAAVLFHRACGIEKVFEVDEFRRRCNSSAALDLLALLSSAAAVAARSFLLVDDDDDGGDGEIQRLLGLARDRECGRERLPVDRRALRRGCQRSVELKRGSFEVVHGGRI